MMRIAVVAATLLLAMPAPMRGQATADHPTDVVTTAAGEQYRAGPLRRWILGRHYRDLWTTAITVPVADLASLALAHTTESDELLKHYANKPYARLFRETVNHAKEWQLPK